MRSQEQSQGWFGTSPLIVSKVAIAFEPRILIIRKKKLSFPQEVQKIGIPRPGKYRSAQDSSLNLLFFSDLKQREHGNRKLMFSLFLCSSRQIRSAGVTNKEFSVPSSETSNFRLLSWRPGCQRSCCLTSQNKRSAFNGNAGVDGKEDHDS